MLSREALEDYTGFGKPVSFSSTVHPIDLKDCQAYYLYEGGPRYHVKTDDKKTSEDTFYIFHNYV